MMTRHFNVPDTAPLAVRALQSILEQSPLVWIQAPLTPDPTVGHYKVRPDKKRDDA